MYKLTTGTMILLVYVGSKYSDLIGFIVPEEGWFGQPKYIAPSKTETFYVVSVASCIFLVAL